MTFGPMLSVRKVPPDRSMHRLPWGNPSLRPCLAVAWLLLGCAAAPIGHDGDVDSASDVVRPVPSTRSMATVPLEPGSDDESTLVISEPPEAPRCALQMALIPFADGDFCIDRFEASIVRRAATGDEEWPGNHVVSDVEADIVAVSVAGRKPQGFISGVQAAVACERAGKRLCQSEEWMTACRGPEETRYPYGNERRAGVCNDPTARPNS